MEIKNILKNSIVPILISIVIIVVWEMYFRIFNPQLGEEIYNNGITMSAADSDLGYVLAPNAMSIHYNREYYPDYKIEYRVNEQGFRDAATYDQVRPRNTIRILLLGDSFSFGVGNQYEKIWPVIMENTLRERGYAVEIIKAGVYGYDTRKEIQYLKKLYSRYRPDIVAINFMFNDLFTNTPLPKTEEEQRERNVESQEVLNEFSDVKTSTLHVLAWAKRIVLSSDILYSNLYMLSKRGKYFDPDAKMLHRNMAITKKLFQAGLRYLAKTPAKLIVLSIPQNFQVVNTKNHINVDYIDQMFGRFAKESGFSWVPVREVLTDAYEKSEKDLYFRLDGHLNNLGNRVVGEYFAGEMEKILQKLWWKSRVVRNQVIFVPYPS